MTEVTHSEEILSLNTWFHFKRRGTISLEWLSVGDAEASSVIIEERETGDPSAGVPDGEIIKAPGTPEGYAGRHFHVGNSLHRRGIFVLPVRDNTSIRVTLENLEVAGDQLFRFIGH